jgi:hypothetical protein
MNLTILSNRLYFVLINVCIVFLRGQELKINKKNYIVYQSEKLKSNLKLFNFIYFVIENEDKAIIKLYNGCRLKIA